MGALGSRHPVAHTASPLATLLPACSGGGKTTLASLLMGLYSPTAGAILVGGVLLSELDLQVPWPLHCSLLCCCCLTF